MVRPRPRSSRARRRRSPIVRGRSGGRLRFAVPSLDYASLVGTPSSSPAQDNALSRHERGFESRWGRSQLAVGTQLASGPPNICHGFATATSGVAGGYEVRVANAPLGSWPRVEVCINASSGARCRRAFARKMQSNMLGEWRAPLRGESRPSPRPGGHRNSATVQSACHSSGSSVFGVVAIAACSSSGSFPDGASGGTGGNLSGRGGARRAEG